MQLQLTDIQVSLRTYIHTHTPKVRITCIHTYAITHQYLFTRTASGYAMGSSLCSLFFYSSNSRILSSDGRLEYLAACSLAAKKMREMLEGELSRGPLIAKRPCTRDDRGGGGGGAPNWRP